MSCIRWRCQRPRPILRGAARRRWARHAARCSPPKRAALKRAQGLAGASLRRVCTGVAAACAARGDWPILRAHSRRASAAPF